MSATIKDGKLCFSVFGRGYEDTRVDSGEGVIDDYNRYGIAVNGASFDVTGQYLWLGSIGNDPSKGLLKYDMDDDFNQIVHNVPTSAVETVMLHASNVANNYGLAVQYGGDWFVFDMTDDTVIANGNNATLATKIAWSTQGYDCILDGTKFRIIHYLTSNGSPEVVTLDYSSGTVTTQVVGNPRSGGTFISENLIYLYYAPQWFYQYKYIEAKTSSDVQIWGNQATSGGSDGFGGMDLMGIGRKGQLITPTNFYSAWRMGVYNGTRTPDFETPKPIRVFGKFESQPTIKSFVFSHEKARFAFNCDLGIFVSDFEDIEKISDITERVYAVSDNYVVAEMGRLDAGHLHSIGVFKYR